MLLVPSFTVSIEYFFPYRAGAYGGILHDALVWTRAVIKAFYEMNPVHCAIFNGTIDMACTLQAYVVFFAFGGSFSDSVIDFVFHRELPFEHAGTLALKGSIRLHGCATRPITAPIISPSLHPFFLY